MQATIEIPGDLFEAAECVAAANQRGVDEIMVQALRDWLAQYAVKSPVCLATYGQGGQLPGVNLDDSSALLSIMDADDDLT